MSGVRLRGVVPADRYALWLWANDPETRRASHDGEPISWADHTASMCQRLLDPAARLLVAEAVGGLPVGSIRFQTGDEWRTARLSYVVAPESRGRGFGGAMVKAGVAQLRRERPGVEVVGAVRLANLPSLRVFRRLGWSESAAGDDVAEFRH
jgi:RimJ/RimL family protein N-acetyltransferase